MTAPPDCLSFPAAPENGFGLKVFMWLHAVSLAAIFFAGALGMDLARTEKAMAIAALVSAGVAAGATLLVHHFLRRGRNGDDDPDILRLTPAGLEGRAFAQKGIVVVAWSRLQSVTSDGHAVEIGVAPADPASTNAADRIGAVRAPAGPAATAREMAAAIEAYRANLPDS